MEILTKSPEGTKKLGRQIANKLKGGEVLALVGDLGSGKTTFTQGLSDGLGIERVNSPTFILMRKYQTGNRQQAVVNKNLYHVDLYRLENNIKQELFNLGVTYLWGKKENIFIIEWADRADKSVFPDNTIWINFETVSDQERKITIKNL